MLNFSATKKEYALISEIATRAFAMIRGTVNEDEYTRLDIMLDIEACHSNGCPLKLSELAAAKDGDFSHDVFGICHHLNRKTGVLEDCFLPRYANR